MLLSSDGITIGEKWTTVLPSEIDGDFFYSVSDSIFTCTTGILAQVFSSCFGEYCQSVFLAFLFYLSISFLD